MIDSQNAIKLYRNNDHLGTNTISVYQNEEAGIATAYITGARYISGADIYRSFEVSIPKILYEYEATIINGNKFNSFSSQNQIASTQNGQISQVYNLGLSDDEILLFNNHIEFTQSSSTTKYEAQQNTLSIKSQKIYKHQGEFQQFPSLDEMQNIAIPYGIAKKAYMEMFDKYPILNSKPLKHIDFISKDYSVADILLTRTYSTDLFYASTTINDLINIANNIYSKDVINYLAISISQGKDLNIVTYKGGILAEGFTFALTTRESLKIVISSDDSIFDNNTGGHLDQKNHVVVSKYEPIFLMHELTHEFANLVFNGNVNPFDESLKSEYNEAVKKFFINIANRFGQTLLSKTNDFAYEELKTQTPLDIITLLESNIESTEVHFLNKYGSKDVNILAKIYEEKLQEFGISPLEAEIMSKIGQLFFQYKYDVINGEIFARFTELMVEYPNDMVMKYFSPIAEYWSSYITPKVSSIIEAQHEYCFDTEAHTCKIQGDLFSNSGFEHCIQELL